MTPDKELGVAMSEAVDETLQAHLLRADGQEDLTFALWSPSDGRSRQTATLHTPLLPQAGERIVHGNVSFQSAYFERALELAARERCGLALLHSHVGPGWQGMSRGDVAAERKIAAATLTLTDLPLIGLTTGTDGTWSARWWPHEPGHGYIRSWCRSVRVVGRQLRSYFCAHLAPVPRLQELFTRTVAVWGKDNHTHLGRLRIGIVGLGSVGSVVAGILARMGLTRFVLIDFDEIQPHNLDRVEGAGRDDIGRLKVHVSARTIRFGATAESVEVRPVASSIAEEEGYRAALDCDVLFSCVDRPRARSILNHLAYAHLIPVIDGGIEVRFREGRFAGVDWQLQTVAPGRPCLECLGTFTPSDASCEADGHLDDHTYLAGLPVDHRYKRNENVFPFSTNLASLEVLQFVALATGVVGMPEIGVQRYRYLPGIVEADTERRCCPGCQMASLTGRVDQFFSLWGRDHAAEQARQRQSAQPTVLQNTPDVRSTLEVTLVDLPAFSWMTGSGRSFYTLPLGVHSTGGTLS